MKIRAASASNGMLLSFADDGIGTSEEQFARLFDPFYRTDPARRHPSSRSGLGLSIVREAVEHMGGKVWAESVPDGGLCVNILIKEAVENGKYSDY